jgi:hypothetical protein
MIEIDRLVLIAGEENILPISSHHGAEVFFIARRGITKMSITNRHHTAILIDEVLQTRRHIESVRVH